MNTVHDLRDTLAEHAEIHDVEIGTRSSSIARRVRVVRRRRAAGVAGAAAAAVVAATVGLSNLGTGTHAAPVASVLGIDVPATLTSTGYTFDYASSATAPAGSDVASVSVDPKDTPVLVSWATQDADQHVRVSTAFDDFTSSLPDFADFVLVPSGAGPTTVKVRGSSRTALAVYHLDPTPPAGVTGAGVTFRQDVAGRQLLAARIGDAGANRIDFSVTVPAGVSQLTFSDLCSAPGEGDRAWVRTSIDGDGWTGHSCGSGLEMDPGATTGYDPQTTYHAGQVVHVEVSLGHARGAGLITDPAARIGLAAYAVTTPPRTFPDGLSLPVVTEQGGHTWRMIGYRTGVAKPGEAWTSPLLNSTERVMTVYAINTVSGGASAWPLLDGKAWGDGMSVGRGVTGMVTASGGTIDPGHHSVGLSVHGTGSAQVALGLYALAD